MEEPTEVEKPIAATATMVEMPAGSSIDLNDVDRSGQMLTGGG